MTRLQPFLLVVALGLAAIGALSAAPGDESGVRAFMRTYSESWARSEDLHSFYAADATHIGADVDWVRRRMASARFEVESVSFLAERVALVGGRLRTGGAAGFEGELVERFSFVLKLTSAGWKIAGSRVTRAERR